MSLVSREVLSKGIFGVFAVSLTLGAVQFASGRDLGDVSQASTVSSEAGINRAAKANRAHSTRGSAGQSETISLRLDSLSDMSVLVRVPLAEITRPHSSAPAFTATSGERKVACEPVVSMLTEVANQLQPGRCVT